MSNESVREMWAERFGRPDPKIVCVGLNYAAHAGESGGEPPKAPLLFGKFANTLLWDGDPIVARSPASATSTPRPSSPLVIGERASDVPEASAMDVIAAYTCANDVSARDMPVRRRAVVPRQEPRRLLPARARSSSTPPTSTPRTSASQQRLNGEVLQDARTSDLIFTIPVLVSYISQRTSRSSAGDLILTGTPEGVGVFRDPKISLADGDVVEIEIEGIGVLRNEVRARERRASGLPLAVARSRSASYEVVIVGGGGHGLATAYYLAKEHGITDVAVLERGWLAGGNIARNTTVIRSNYLWDESAAIYEHALQLWEGLEAGARLRPAVQPARRAQPRAHAAGRPRRRCGACRRTC